MEQEGTEFSNFNVPAKDEEGNDIFLDTKIQKAGDVNYDPSTKSLKFNESSDNKLGEGGYLKLSPEDSGKNMDFSNGFTFEFYGKLSRLGYINSSGSDELLGLFCKISRIGPNNPVNAAYSMRFGFMGLSEGNTICKFYRNSSWNGQGNNLITSSSGGILTNNPGYNVNEKFYLTFCYTVFDDEKNDEYQKQYYKENNEKIDRVEYYINGELYGKTYYGTDSYIEGRNLWDSPNVPFFVGIGVSGWSSNVYYLKGEVYTTRLYVNPMTEEQVKKSYDMTLRYRDTF